MPGWAPCGVVTKSESGVCSCVAGQVVAYFSTRLIYRMISSGVKSL